MGNKPSAAVQNPAPKYSALPAGANKNAMNVDKYKQMLNMPGNGNIPNSQNFKPAFVDHVKADKDKIAEILKAADPRVGKSPSTKDIAPMKRVKSENNDLNNKHFDVARHMNQNKPAFVPNALKNAGEQKAAPARPVGGIIGKLQKAKSD